MKKIISLVLCLCLLVCAFSMPVSAVEANQVVFSHSELESIYSARAEYIGLLESGHISIDNNGYIAVTNEALISNELEDAIYVVNKLVEIELLMYEDGRYVCNSSANFVITEADDADFFDLDGEIQSINQDNTRASVCDCNYDSLNLGSMVRNNAASMRSVYSSMLVASPHDAVTATEAYWLGKVREEGDWDYKAKSGYIGKTFCCSYGLNNYKKHYHLTSEFIGNYNFGYTGNLLFSLTTLKVGSAIVAGSWEKDVHDHPAIEEGYADADAYGEYLG